jgi:hypothetical protein
MGYVVCLVTVCLSMLADQRTCQALVRGRNVSETIVRMFITHCSVHEVYDMLLRIVAEKVLLVPNNTTAVTPLS